MSELIPKHLNPEQFCGPAYEDIEQLVDYTWQELIGEHYDQGQAYAFIIAMLTKYADDVGYTSRDLFLQFTTTLKLMVKAERIPL